MPHPAPSPYAIRRARADERGRWVICRNGFPDDVLGRDFMTKWGARRTALRWKRKNEAATRMEPV